MNETELIKDALGGNQHAFSKLYEENYSFVYNTCVNLLRAPDAAEDMTQDIFAKAFNKLHLFRGDARFRTWLYRIAYNEFLQSRRRRKLRSISLDQHLASNDEAFESKYLGREDRRFRTIPDELLLKGALGDMTDKNKMVFDLWAQGHSEKEISEQLNISVPAAKSRRFHVKLAIARRLGYASN